MTYTIWDSETSIITAYKRKANPFIGKNFVVMQGYKRKGQGKPGFGAKADYFGTAGKLGAPGMPDQWFIKLLLETKILVGQSIKFDLLHALQNKANHAFWMKWIADGGMIWDIQLAEYLLMGMTPSSHMMSLDEIAPKYGGSTKVDEVKALWEAGVSTEDIDRGLLLRYLVGDRVEHKATAENGEEVTWEEGDFGDIGNTELAFLGQYRLAVDSGQLKSILLNMGSLVCTIEMELNGMAVDVALGRKQAAELADKLAALTVSLVSYLPEDLPFDFSWSSRFHKSALIFGGTVKYDKWKAHLDEHGNNIYPMKDEVHYVLEDGTTMECSAWHAPDSVAADVVRYASGKNAGEAKTKKVKVPNLDKPKGAVQPHYYTFPGYTTPSDRWKTANEGVYSTAGEVIEELKVRDIPFLTALAEQASLAKDLGTYYVTTDPKTGEEKGMLTLVQVVEFGNIPAEWRQVDGWGIIHHMLNHTSTVTARFSSSNPNLQNLPKEGKSTVKTLFISRFVNGKIIQSDFTALEVYVQAILTKCKQLIADLKAGLDMHCARVASKEGVSYEDALLWCKGDKAQGIAPKEGWPKKRSGAKEFSFQRTYGAGAALISESTGIPREEIDALIVAENERYPEIEPFYANMTAQIEDVQFSTNTWVDHPDIPGAKCNLLSSYYITPDGKKYSYRQHPAPKFLAEKPANKGGKLSSFSPTEIKNYIVQGSGGEWAKAAMWLAVRAFYKRGNFGGLALLVNQVHDALYVDADDSVALEAAALLEACMLAASDFMEWYFGWFVPVPVPSETMWGENMMDENPMPKGFTEKVEGYRTGLRAEYMNGYLPTFVKG